MSARLAVSPSSSSAGASPETISADKGASDNPPSPFTRSEWRVFTNRMAKLTNNDGTATVPCRELTRVACRCGRTDGLGGQIKDR